METFDGSMHVHGVGIGGWRTRYRRLEFIPPHLRTIVTEGHVGHAAWNCPSTSYDASRFSTVGDRDHKPLDDELVRTIN